MTSALPSVAMCTYNGARYLPEQLESIARQSVLPGELIISDDGSTDATLEILERFAAVSAFPVRVLMRDTRLGVSKNFETAIRECRGDIIFLSDQDDVWKPCRIERSLAAFQGHGNLQYVFSDAELIDDRGQHIGTSLWQFDREVSRAARAFRQGSQLDVLLRRNIVTGATMAFRSSLKQIALPIPTGWIHDYWIALLGSIFGHGQLLAQPLLRYRMHSGQQLGVANWTVWQKCTRSLPDTAEDYRTRCRDYAELEARISGVEFVPGAARQKIRDKVLHLKTRKNSHESKGFARLNTVLREMMSGRYARYSNSWRSMLRDLCPGRAAQFLRQCLQSSDTAGSAEEFNGHMSH